MYNSGILKQVEEMFAVTSKVQKVEKPRDLTEKIKVLSDKKAQNVMIFLNTLKNVSVENIVDSIRVFDTSKLSDTVLKNCVDSYPTDEEKKQLKIHGLDANFRTAESFVIAVIFVN